MYDREIGCYRHLHALLKQLRAAAGVTDAEVPLDVPELYYANLKGESETGDTVLVMENLKIQGYEMSDKLVGCTYEQANVTLTALANYHSLSIAFMRTLATSSGDYQLPENLKFILDKTMCACKIIYNIMPILAKFCSF